MSVPAPIARNETQLLAAARGDPQKFGELAEPYRRELQVHCYRILGSLHEAEDMVQETMVKAWRHLSAYEGRASFRSWLYRIATNTCLDLLDSKRSRRLLPFQMDSPWDPLAAVPPPSAEMLWLEPFPDEWLEDRTAANPEARYSRSESISLAFLAAIQALPPRQRAVLILRDVLDFSANETAGLLEVTVSSVNSALNRARKTLAQRYRGGSPDTAGLPPADEKSRWLLDHFVQAWEAADVSGLVALLKQDAVLAMPPSRGWYQGSAAISTFVSRTIFADNAMFTGMGKGRWRLLPARANGSPAFAMYQRAEGHEYRAFGILLLEGSGGKLSQITNFIDPSLPVLFGLPAVLA